MTTPSAQPEETATGRRRGRPRSEAARQAVLSATARLFDEHGCSFDSLSIEGIAAEAGVGKQTIYRWWSSKSAVVLESMLSGHLSVDFPEVPDTGNILEDLLAWGDEMIEVFSADGVSLARNLVAATVAEGIDLQEEVLDAPFWEHDQLKHRLHEEAERGGLRPEVSVAVVASALMDPILLRHLTGGRPEPEWVHQLVRLVVSGAVPPGT